MAEAITQNSAQCPCCSGKPFTKCCEPYLSGKQVPPTPEALMRSRYTAYVKCAEPYLKATLAPESAKDYSEEDVRKWAKESDWLGLEIVSAEGDTVEFIATYRQGEQTIKHHEVSTFRKQGDRWFFVDGQVKSDQPRAPLVRSAPKTGRNDPCTCGSGKKYKKCCAA